MPPPLFERFERIFTNSKAFPRGSNDYQTNQIRGLEFKKLRASVDACPCGQCPQRDGCQDECSQFIWYVKTGR